MSEEYSSGCLIDPAVRDASVIELMTDGRQPICGDNPGIKGAWERLKARGVRVVFLAPLMAKYFPTRRNDLQNGNRSAKPIPDPGTCVARATYRGAMLTYLRQIDEQKIVAKPTVFAFEPIYGGGRVVIGRKSIRGGGMYGGHAAQWVSKYGMVERNRFGAIDLSLDTPEGRTDLAYHWGEQGLPPELIEAAKKHPFDAHLARNVDEQHDALACGFGGAFSKNFTCTERDRYGIANLTPSAHSETVCGVGVCHDGEDGTFIWNSWANSPGGSSTFVAEGGATVAMPPGCSFVRKSTLRKWWGDAESWHFECREGSQWR